MPYDGITALYLHFLFFLHNLEGTAKSNEKVFNDLNMCAWLSMNGSSSKNCEVENGREKKRD